jgi:TPR repeat protein
MRRGGIALVFVAACAGVAPRDSEPAGATADNRADGNARVPPTTAELERACQATDASVCARVAELFWDGRSGHPHDVARSFRYASRGCEARIEYACALLGRHYESGIATSWDPARAADLYDKSCTAGIGLACALLAEMYSTGHGIDVERRKAASYRTLAHAHWLAACNRGELQWCTDASRLTLVEAGSDGAEIAIQLDRRACEGGVARSCARILSTPLHGPVSPESVRELDKLCAGGEPSACTGLARLLDRSIAPGGREDPERTGALIRRACDLGDGEACLIAGMQNAKRSSASRSERRRYYSRACDRGVADGCMYLAVQAAIARRDADAMPFAQRGCQMGGRPACELIARHSLRRRDEAAARRWLTEACKLGSWDACGYLLEHNTELPGLSHATAVPLYGAACKEGKQVACQRLAQITKRERDDLKTVLAALTTQDTAALAKLAPQPVALQWLWFDSPECAAFSRQHRLVTAEHTAFLGCLANARLRIAHREESGMATDLIYEPAITLTLDVRDGMLERIAAPRAAIYDEAAAPLEFSLLMSHLVSGASHVEPDSTLREKIERSPDAVAYAHLLVCVDPAGAVERATVNWGSRDHDSYMRAVEAAAAKWRFTPFVAHGKPVRVCAEHVFVYPYDRAKKIPLPLPPDRSESRARASSGTSAPQNVAPMALDALRIAGEKNIVPDDETKNAIGLLGYSKLVGSFKLCITMRGDIDSVAMLKSTGFDIYDRIIIDGIYRWRYRPFLVNGKPTPVCTAVTFIYSQR